jgi:hypothetical protein
LNDGRLDRAQSGAADGIPTGTRRTSEAN